MSSGQTDKAVRDSLPWVPRRNEGENRTGRDFELRRELNRLADLNYAVRGHIIQEALKDRGRERVEAPL
jgi:hypothetical protein